MYNVFYEFIIDRINKNYFFSDVFKRSWRYYGEVNQKDISLWVVKGS